MTNSPDIAWTWIGRLYALTLLCSAIGFYRTVYFISLGYALSIGALSVATLVSARHTLNAASLAHGAALIAWAARLGIFLRRREALAGYRARSAEQEPPPGPVWRQGLIWATVSALYVAMFSPAEFAWRARHGGSASRWAGVLTMLFGLALETAADEQKSRAKRAAPDLFCDRGIYQVVRCPNYLGEIVFWSGNWLAGVATYQRSPWRWLLTSSGLISIVLIMLGSTRRLELSQEARYGARPDYQSYVRRVPVLIPGIPLYSLKQWRLRLG